MKKNAAGISLTMADISRDPDYKNFRIYYEQATFNQCKQLLVALQERYPQHPQLLIIDENLEVKLSLDAKKAARKKDEKFRKKKATLNLCIFAIICTLFTMTAVFLSYFYLNEYATSRQKEIDNPHLMALHHQIDQLLLVGQPKTAAEVLDKIRLINPRYEHLPELSTQIYDMLVLDVKYQSALDLVTQSNYDDALVMFQEVEREKPGLWDVSQQITSLGRTILISDHLEAANNAYQSEAWAEVIDAYENTMFLEPNLQNHKWTEQLAISYMQNLIRTLENNPSSSQNVESAEQDYAKAVLLISQLEVINSDIEDLQNLSEQLLIHHYSQMAKTLLEDKQQNTNTISKAMSYYRKAMNFLPEDTALVMNLQNTRYYQLGTQQFSNENWERSILYFSLVSTSDPEFASENLSILLYEAYFALGREHYLAGRHTEAHTALEQAEILALGSSDNLMKLFQVQILSGDNAEKMSHYDQAAHYYHAALEAIQITNRLIDHPLLAQKYDQAFAFMMERNYGNAAKVFQEFLQDITPIYNMVEVEITNGAFLALFAHENDSTIKAITDSNTLENNPIDPEKRTITVPVIDK